MNYKLAKKAIAAALVCLSVVSASGCGIVGFRQNTSEIPVIEESTKITRGYGNVIENGDFSEPEKIADEIAEISESYAEENNLKFEKATVSRVVDGDTIVVDVYADNCGNKEHEYKVRFIGVNTPESVASQEYLDKKGTENSEEGKVASNFTKELLPEGCVVYLEKDISDEDMYGRLLRYVWLEVPDEITYETIATEMVNGILVDRGYAEAVAYKPDVEYREYFEEMEENYGKDR